MKKYLKLGAKLIALIISLILITLSLAACLPNIATDKTIIGIVEDGLVHTDNADYKGYIYGNKDEKYNIMFRLKLPENYDDNKQYSIVIYLHGLGAQGTNNEDQIGTFVNAISYYNQEDCIVFVPQLPSEKMTYSPNFWKSKDMSSLYNSALDAVIDKYSVDENRIYILLAIQWAHIILGNY